MNCPCPKHPFSCYGHPITCGCQTAEQSRKAALQQIWNIVHTPTKATKHKAAGDHFQADFDAIRRIIKLVEPLIHEDCGDQQ